MCEKARQLASLYFTSTKIGDGMTDGEILRVSLWLNEVSAAFAPSETLHLLTPSPVSPFSSAMHMESKMGWQKCYMFVKTPKRVVCNAHNTASGRNWSAGSHT